MSLLVGSDKFQFEILTKLSGHTAAVTSVKFSPDNRLFASASADKTIRIWETTNFHLEAELLGHSSGISDISWANDSRHLCSASDDKTIKLWDVFQKKCLKTFTGHANFVMSIMVSNQSNLLVSGSYDETIRLWDMTTGSALHIMKGHEDPVLCVAFDRNDAQVVSASADSTIRLWDVLSGQCLKTIAFSTPVSVEPQPATFVSFSPNNAYIMASWLNSEHRLVAYSRDKCARRLVGHVNVKQFIQGAFLGATVFASGSEDNNVYLWSINDRSHVALAAHSDVPITLHAHPSFNTFASAGLDKTIVIWKKIKQ